MLGGLSDGKEGPDYGKQEWTALCLVLPTLGANCKLFSEYRYVMNKYIQRNNVNRLISSMQLWAKVTNASRTFWIQNSRVFCSIHDAQAQLLSSGSI
jgi:hypothetical protein